MPFDTYAGSRALYAPDAEGKVRVREAACWAHLRRDFHDVWTATGSPIAREALERIGRLYEPEKRLDCEPAEVRLAARQAESRPVVEAFRAWCERQLRAIPGKGDFAKAMRYGLNSWPSFTLFLEDGRVAIDKNAAERAIKPVVLEKRTFSSQVPTPAARSSPMR